MIPFHSSFSCNQGGFLKQDFPVTSFLLEVFVTTDLPNLSIGCLIIRVPFSPACAPPPSCSLHSTSAIGLFVSPPSYPLFIIPDPRSCPCLSSISSVFSRQDPREMTPSSAILIAHDISKRTRPGLCNFRVIKSHTVTLTLCLFGRVSQAVHLIS